MKIVYEFKDLLRLIRAECEQRGCTLTTASDSSTSREAAVTFNMEWNGNAPLQLPAPAESHLEETVAKARAYLEERAEAKVEIEVEAEPTPEEVAERRREKNREYNRRWSEKKKADQAHARQVIEQVGTSAHKNTETHEEREQRRTAVVAARKEQEVVAPAEVPFQWSGIGRASL